MAFKIHLNPSRRRASSKSRLSSRIDRFDNTPPRRCSTPFTAPPSKPRHRVSAQRSRAAAGASAAAAADPAGAAVCELLAGVLIPGPPSAASASLAAIIASSRRRWLSRTAVRPSALWFVVSPHGRATSCSRCCRSSVCLLVLRRLGDPRQWSHSPPSPLSTRRRAQLLQLVLIPTAAVPCELELRRTRSSPELPAPRHSPPSLSRPLSLNRVALSLSLSLTFLYISSSI
ncbi:hypothetical protein Scep_010070 [Stephania cephalantha]|uniref:Uncharacterized protein n=1 Tax=Stephania cephalantha TaxID=152367 RepID=A0AAP0JV50_9MAGN